MLFSQLEMDKTSNVVKH